jgi:hypothetical protein
LRWPLFVKTDLYKERELMRKVLGGLTDFDPRTRLSYADALRILDPTNNMLRSTTKAPAR